MERTIGGKSEGFQLVIRADGNYLTVYPEGEDTPAIALETLRDKLKEAQAGGHRLPQLPLL